MSERFPSHTPITESIYKPYSSLCSVSFCRLWDAVGGFLFLFSHMQDKLSKHSSQVDLLKELLNLQKDMITMMLSMLEGTDICDKIIIKCL